MLLEMLGLTFLLEMVIMTSLWVVYLFYRNGILVDFGKAISFIAIGIVFFLMGEGFWLRKIVLMAMVIIWAARLAWSLIARMAIGANRNRYNQFAMTLNMSPMGIFYLLFILQGLIAIVLSIAFLPAIQNPSQSVDGWEALGAFIWLIAVWGETVADHQLREFEKDPNNKNLVLQTGLWKYSRHPNYFCEWLVWIGFALFALGSPWGWVAWIAPILVLYLTLCIIGIPLSERFLEHTKGDLYREYQRRTSIFFPWFPKS